MDIPKGTQRVFWITGIIFCIVTTFTFLSTTLVQAPSPIVHVNVPPQGPITITGTMVCLPHKNTEGPQTMECAFGLKDDTGRYFALSDTDPNYGNIIGVPMNIEVTVEGMFGPRTDSKYQDIGIISVTKIIRASDDADAGASGIKGTTLLGPTCPVERIPPEPGCADKPFKGTLAAFNASKQVVKQFSTASDGSFEVALPPGTYTISSVAANPLPRCSSDVITVRSGAFTQAEVSCDTGIR